MNCKAVLPGITVPGEATHKYENEHGKVTFYKVTIQRNIFKFYNKVWFWDVYRKMWVRSHCYPHIDVMTKICR